MSKEDEKGNIYNQMAWILNYQPNIEHQHIYMGKKDGRDDSPGEDSNDDNEPLKNFIFISDLFKTNDRLIKLRNTIAAAIDMGDDTKKYGEPQEKRLDPSVKCNWFYIQKALIEAGLTKSKSDEAFVEQMVEWYPQLFTTNPEEQFEDMKRRYAKSISEERKHWKKPDTKIEVKLVDMWHENMGKILSSEKAKRIDLIVCKGLLSNLKKLKV